MYYLDYLFSFRQTDNLLKSTQTPLQDKIVITTIILSWKKSPFLFGVVPSYPTRGHNSKEKYTCQDRLDQYSIYQLASGSRKL